MEMNDVKIIAAMPAYNEAKRIGPVIKQARRYVDEVIVVDDFSEDNTFEVAKKAGAKVFRLSKNEGVGFATRVACDLAIKEKADIIVTLDADGQHAPEDIPKMVEALIKNKADIVFGCRQRTNAMPFKKRFGNLALSTIAWLLFNVKISDTQTGFHAFTNSAYKKLRWESKRYELVSEFVARTWSKKLKYVEVPVQTIYVDKEHGMGVKDAIKSVLKMIKWRFKGMQSK